MSLENENNQIVTTPGSAGVTTSASTGATTPASTGTNTNGQGQKPPPTALSGAVNSSSSPVSASGAVEKAPYLGYGKTTENFNGINYYSYAEGTPMKDVEVGSLMTKLGGDFSVEDYYESLDELNGNPTFDKEAFVEKNKDHIDEDKLTALTGHMEGIVNGYNEAKSQGQVFSRRMKNGLVTKSFLTDIYDPLGFSEGQKFTDYQSIAYNTGSFIDDDGLIKNIKKEQKEANKKYWLGAGGLFLAPIIGTVNAAAIAYGSEKKDKTAGLTASMSASGAPRMSRADAEGLGDEGEIGFWGPKKAESTALGTVVRAGISGTVGMASNASAFMYMSGYKVGEVFHSYSDEIKAYEEQGFSSSVATHMAEEDYAEKSLAANKAKYYLRQSNHFSQMNLDEEGSLFDESWDWNRSMYAFTDAAIQILPSMFTGGATTAGGMLVKGALKAGLRNFGLNSSKKAILGAGGNAVKKAFVKNSMIEVAANQLSLVYGAASVGGLMTKELMNAGMSMSDAYKYGAMYGAITYGSEKILDWNYGQRLGFRAVQSWRKKHIDSKVLRESLSDVAPKIFKEEGIDAVTSLDGPGKKSFVKKMFGGFSEIRSKKFMEKGGKVLWAGVEENIEETAEGVAQSRLSAWVVNSQIVAGADHVTQSEKGAKIERQLDQDGVFTGNYTYTNKKGEKHTIDHALKTRYEEYLKLSGEVLNGEHLVDESVNMEEGMMAMLGTWASAGVIENIGIINSSKNKKMQAAQYAEKIYNNPKAKEAYDASLAEIMENGNAVQKEVASSYDEEVQLYVNLITKYGLDDIITEAAQLKGATIVSTLLEHYAEKDRLAEILEKTKDKEFDFEKDGAGFANTEEISKRLNWIDKEIVRRYHKKKNLTDAKGKEMPAKHSLEYSRHWNFMTNWEKSIEFIAKAIGEKAGKAFSDDDKDPEYVTAYSKAYDAAKKKLNTPIEAGAEERISQVYGHTLHGLREHQDELQTNYGFTLESNNSKNRSSQGSSIYTRFKVFLEAREKEFTDDINGRTADTESLQSTLESIMAPYKEVYKAYQDALIADKKDGTNTAVEKKADLVKLLKESRKVPNKDSGKDDSVGGIRGMMSKFGVKQAMSKMFSETIPGLAESNLGEETRASINMLLDTYEQLQGMLGPVSQWEEEFDFSSTPIDRNFKGIPNAVPTEAEQSEITKEAMKDTLNEMDLSKADSTLVKGFIEKMQQIIDDDGDIPKDEASAAEVHLLGIQAFIGDMIAYLDQMEHSEELEKDPATAEHSSLASHPEARMTTDDQTEIRDWLNGLEMFVAKGLAKVDASIGKRAERLRKDHILNLEAQLIAFTFAVQQHGKDMDKKKLKAVEASIDKISKLLLKVKEESKENNLPDASGMLSLHYMIKHLGDPPPKKGEKKGKQTEESRAANKTIQDKYIKDYLWTVEKEIVKIFDNLSGQLDGTMTYLKDTLQENDNDRPPQKLDWLHKGQPYSHSTPGFDGEFDPEKIRAGINKVYDDPESLHTLVNDANTRAALGYYWTILEMANNMGRNGSMSYSDVLNQYRSMIAGNSVAMKQSDVAVLHSATYPQMLAVAQIIGFLESTDNSSHVYDKVADGGPLDNLIQNAITLRGYAGAGKTTFVIHDVLKLWLTNKANRGKKILYVSPSPSLEKAFKASIEDLNLEDDMSFVNINRFEDEADWDQYSMIIYDEASLISEKNLGTATEPNREIDRLAKKMNAYKGKVILIADDDQVSDMDTIGLFHALSNHTMKTIPITEIFRTGIVQFSDIQGMIRADRLEGDKHPENWKFRSRPMVYEKIKGLEITNELKGGQLARTSKEVVEAFRQRLKLFNADTNSELSDEDVILIVINDEAYDAVIADYNLTDTEKKFLKVATRSKHDDVMISGLKARYVFVAIDFNGTAGDFKSSGTPVTDMEIHHKSKVALTTMSRATQYLMMVATDDVKADQLSVEGTVHENAKMTLEAQNDEAFAKSIDDITWLNAILDEKKPPAVVDPPVPGELVFEDDEGPTRSSSAVSLTSNVMHMVKLLKDLALNKRTVKDLKGKIRASELKTVLAELDKLKSSPVTEKTAAKNLMLIAAIKMNLYYEQYVQAHTMDEAIVEIEAYKKLIGIESLVKAWMKTIGENPADKGLVEAHMKSLRTVAPPSVLSAIPNTMGKELTSSLVISPILFDDTHATNPMSMEIVGYTERGGHKVPIINLHYVRISGTTKPSAYDRAHMAAQVALAAKMGFVINTISQHNMKNIAATNTFAVERVASVTLTPLDLQKEISDVNNELKKADDFAGLTPDVFAKRSELYGVERQLHHRHGYEVGDIVSHKGIRQKIISISASFNGTSYDYFMHFKDSAVSVKFTDQTSLEAEVHHYNPTTDAIKFSTNAVNFSLGKDTEHTPTTYLPLVTGAFYSASNVYDDKGKQAHLMRSRKAVFSFFSKNKNIDFEVHYSSATKVVALDPMKNGTRKVNKSKKFDTIYDSLAIVVPDADIIEFIAKNKITDSKGKVIPSSQEGLETFKRNGLHILAYANPVDIGFRKENGMASTLFDSDTPAGKKNSYDAITKGVAQALANEEEMDFDTFLSQFSDELTAIFEDGNVFPGKEENNQDGYANELVKFNSFRIYRIAIARARGDDNPMTINLSGSTNRVLLEGNKPQSLSALKKDAAQQGIVLNDEIEFVGLNKEENVSGRPEYHLGYSDANGKGVIVVRGILATDNTFADLDADIANIKKEYAALEVALNATVDSKENERLRMQFLADIFNNSLSYQFLKENTRVLSSNNLDEINKAYSQFIYFKEVFTEDTDPETGAVVKSSAKRVLSMKGSLAKEVANLGNMINLLKEQSRKKGGVNLYMPPRFDSRYQVTQAKGFGMPTLSTVPNTEIAPSSGGIDGSGKNTIFNRSVSADVNETLSDSKADVQAELNRLLGALGLSHMGFSVEIDPRMDTKTILGRMENAFITLLEANDKSSIKTARHEAMHFIVEHLLSSKDRHKLMSSTTAIMRSKGILNPSYTDVHEFLADTFMDKAYLSLEGNSKQRNILKKFYNWIKGLLGYVADNENYVKQFMINVDNRGYSDSEINNSSTRSFDMAMDNEYTTKKAFDDIVTAFGGVSISTVKSLAKTIFLRKYVSTYGFANKSLNKTSTDIMAAVQEYLNDVRKIIPKAFEYKYTDTKGNTKTKRIKSADVRSGKHLNDFIKADSTVNEKGNKYPENEEFMLLYMLSFLMPNVKTDAKADKLLNTVLQMVFTGIDIATEIEAEENGSIERGVNKFVVRDVKSDNAATDPLGSQSEKYALSMEVIPYVNKDGKVPVGAESYGRYADGKILHSYLLQAAANLKRKGVGFSSEMLFDELRNMAPREGVRGGNTIYSFLYYVGNMKTEKPHEVWASKDRLGSWNDSGNVGTKKGYTIGMYAILSDRKLQEQAKTDPELKQKMIEYRNYIDGLTMFYGSLYSRVTVVFNANNTKSGLKFKEVQVNKRVNGIDEFNANKLISDHISTDDVLNLDINKYVTDGAIDDLAISFDESLVVDFLYKTSGISLSKEALKRMHDEFLTSTGDNFKNSIMAFAEYIKFLSDNRSAIEVANKKGVFIQFTASQTKDLRAALANAKIDPGNKTLTDWTIFKPLLNDAYVAQTKARSIVQKSFYINVNGDLEYTNLVSSYFFDNVFAGDGDHLSSSSMRDFFIAKEMAKKESIFGREVGKKMVYYNSILNGSFDMESISVFGGVKTKTSGYSNRTLSKVDKLNLLRQMLLSKANLGTDKFQELYAFSDAMADKNTMPLIKFILRGRDHKRANLYNPETNKINESLLAYHLLTQMRFEAQAIAVSRSKFEALGLDINKTYAEDTDNGKKITQNLIASKDYTLENGMISFHNARESAYGIDHSQIDGLERAGDAAVLKFARKVHKKRYARMTAMMNESGFKLTAKEKLLFPEFSEKMKLTSDAVSANIAKMKELSAELKILKEDDTLIAEQEAKQAEIDVLVEANKDIYGKNVKSERKHLKKLKAQLKLTKEDPNADILEISRLEDEIDASNKAIDATLNETGLLDEMVAAGYLIEKDGDVKMHPMLESMYWSHYLGNKTVHSLARGEVDESYDVIDWVKRAAGVIAPGTLYTNAGTIKYFGKGMRTLIADDLIDENALYSDKPTESTDGKVILSPLAQAIMIKITGGENSAVSTSSLKNVFNGEDTDGNRVYIKGNDFPITEDLLESDIVDGKVNYLNKYYGSALALMLGKELTIKFEKLLVEGKSFDEAMDELAEFIMSEEGVPFRDKVISRIAFKSSVKLGLRKVQPMIDENGLPNTDIKNAVFNLNDNNDDKVITLDPMGLRMQQITSQNSFNSKTSIPIQILRIAGSSQIDEASAGFANELLSMLSNKTGREAVVDRILKEESLRSQRFNKSAELLALKGLSKNTASKQFIQAISSFIRKNMTGDMPGSYHIQAPHNGNRVDGQDRQLKVTGYKVTDQRALKGIDPALLSSGNIDENSNIKNRALLDAILENPNNFKYIKFQKSEVIMGFTHADLFGIKRKTTLRDSMTIDFNGYKTSMHDVSGDETMMFYSAKIDAAFSKGLITKADIEKALPPSQAKVVFARLERINASITDKAQEAKDRLDIKIKEAGTKLENETLRTDVYEALGFTEEKITDTQKEKAISSYAKFTMASIRDKKDTTIAEYKKYLKRKADKSKKSVSPPSDKTTYDNRARQALAEYYFNFNKALDVFYVRIPTTDASMGSPSRIASFLWDTRNTVYTSTQKNLLDGSDYDADQMNIFYRAFDENGDEVGASRGGKDEASQKLLERHSKNNKHAINQNKLFNGLMNYYNNLENVRHILSTISTQRLEDRANALSNKDEDYAYNLGSSLDMQETNNDGVNLVGHGANLTSALFVIDGINKRLASDKKLDLGVVENANSVFEAIEFGTLFTNGATDNAKLGGALGRLNVNSYTSPLLTGVVMNGGVSPELQMKLGFKVGMQEIGLDQFDRQPLVKNKDKILKKMGGLNIFNYFLSTDHNRITSLSDLDIGLDNLIVNENLTDNEKAKAVLNLYANETKDNKPTMLALVSQQLLKYNLPFKGRIEYSDDLIVDGVPASGVFSYSSLSTPKRDHLSFSNQGMRIQTGLFRPAQVVVHEMIHAYTSLIAKAVDEGVDTISIDNDTKITVTKEMKEGIDSLTKMLTKARKLTQAQGITEWTGAFYGLTNVKEFMAEILTNDKFMLEMAKLDLAEKGTLSDTVKKLFNSVLKILGIKDTHGTLAAAYDNLFNKVMGADPVKLNQKTSYRSTAKALKKLDKENILILHNVQLKEMINVLGFDKAMNLYAANNFHHLSLTPEGKPSQLFQDLEAKFGMYNALTEKAKYYTEAFMLMNGENWIEEKSGEPEMQADQISNSLEDIIFALLQDKGIKEATSALRKKNNISSKFPPKLVSGLGPVDNDMKKEVTSLLHLGEQTKRFTDFLGIYKGTEALPEKIEALHYKLERNLGMSIPNFLMRAKEYNRTKNADVFADSKEQIQFIKEVLNEKHVSPNEVHIRNSMNLALLLANKADTLKQLEALELQRQILKENILIYKFKVDGQSFLDAYKEKATTNGYKYSEEDIQSLHNELENVNTGYFIDSLKKVKLPFGGKAGTDVRSYDMRKEADRIQYGKDFPAYLASIRNVEKNGTNVFLNSLSILSTGVHGMKTVEFEKSGIINPDMERDMQVSFSALSAPVKEAFRVYQLIRYGFKYRSGSMSNVMDSAMEEQYTKWEQGTSTVKGGSIDNLPHQERIRILQNIALRTKVGLLKNDEAFAYRYSQEIEDIINKGTTKERRKLKMDVLLSSMNPFGDSGRFDPTHVERRGDWLVAMVDQAEGPLDTGGERIGTPQYYISTPEGIQMATNSYSTLFNTYSSNTSPFQGIFYGLPNANHLEELNSKGSVTITNKSNFYNVAKHDTFANKAVPKTGDIVVLEDGTTASVLTDQKNYVTLTKVGKHSRIKTERIGSGNKILNVLIAKMKAAFPNLRIELISNPNAPIGQVLNGVVYLNALKIQYDTPIHELAHVFMEVLKTSAPEVYEQLEHEVRDLMNTNSSLVKLIKDAYPDLSETELLEEIMVTMMGWDGADKVKAFLASVHADQSLAEKIYTKFKTVVQEIKDYVMQMLSDIFGLPMPATIDLSNASIGSIGNQIADAVIAGNVVSLISTEELAELSGVTKESKISNKLDSVEAFTGALSSPEFDKNSTYKGLALKERLKQTLLNENGVLPSFYGMGELSIGTNFSDPATVALMDKVLHEFNQRTNKTKNDIISFLNEFRMNEQEALVKAIFGTKLNEFNEEIPMYSEEMINKMVKAFRYEPNAEYMLYSQLATSKYGSLYDKRFAGYDPMIKIVLDDKGKPIVSIFDVTSYNINAFNYKGNESSLAEAFIDSSEAKKRGLKLANTERVRREMALSLLRNHLHSQNVGVQDLGIMEIIGKNYLYQDIDQVAMSKEIEIMGSIPEVMQAFPKSMAKMFDKEHNHLSNINYIEVLMSRYKGGGLGQSGIYEYWKEGNHGRYELLKTLRERLLHLQLANDRGTNNTIDQSKYSVYELTELRLLNAAIYQLEYLNSTTRNKTNTVSALARSLADAGSFGETFMERVREVVHTSNKAVIAKYDGYMKGFKNKGEQVGLFDWFRKRAGKTAESYTHDVARAIFRDVIVVAKDSKGNNYNAGHIFWTIDEKEDPLYAKLAQAKLAADPTFLKVLEKGKEMVERIDQVIYDNVHHRLSQSHVFFNENTTNKREVDSTKVLEIIDESGYKRGMIPVMGATASEKIERNGFGNMGTSFTKAKDQLSSASEIYEDFDESLWGKDESLFRMNDIFMAQFSLTHGKHDNTPLGNRQRFKNNLGIHVSEDANGNYITEVVNPDLNNDMSYDLERVLGYFFMSASRTIIHESRTLPFINSVKTLLKDDIVNRSINYEENLKWIDDYVNQAVMNRRKKLAFKKFGLDVDKTASLVMHTASFLTMTGNINIGVVSGLTNGANAFTEGISNSIVRALGVDHPHFGAKDLALATVMFGSHYHKMTQLAIHYGVVQGMDYEKVQHRLFQDTKKHIFSQFHINFLNWGTDFYARSVVMTAQMLHDGTWDAHTYDKQTGEVTYDAKLDKRYSKNGKTLSEDGRLLATYKRSQLMLEGKQNEDDGETMLGEDGKTIVKMPTMGYDTEDGATLKWLSDRFVVGAYDNETKNTAGNMMVGRLFQLFHNWIITKIHSAVATGEFTRGGGRYVVKDVVINSKTGETEKMVQWESIWVEGYMTTFFSLIKNVLTGDFKAISEMNAYQKKNLAKVAVLALMYLGMNMMYNLAVGSDWDDAEENDKLPPYRLLKNIKYSTDSLISGLILWEIFQDPFILSNIVGNLFQNQYGEFDLSQIPFKSQASVIKEFQLMTSSDPFADRKVMKAKEAARRKAINEPFKTEE